MNKENLNKLADYLLSGQLKADFDMRRFDDGHLGMAAPICGSVGCAVGHGPYAGIEKHKNECWSEYSDRFSGLKTSCIIYVAEWDWCFNPKWADVDNTPEGAAKRINYLLNNGLPHNWRRQIQGLDPISY